MLSDIPVAHVTYLKKENGVTRVVTKSEQTFADNIYRLYADSFFLTKNEGRNRIWIHGAFAEKIIDYIYEVFSQAKAFLEIDKKCAVFENEEYEKIKEELDYAYDNIKLIGEPFLKRILLAEWEDIRNKINKY